MNIGLKLENVSFKFTAQSHEFFKNINVTFDQGKLHFVRGPNGAGKSTLFRLVQGTLDQHEIATGNVYVGSKKYHYVPGKNQKTRIHEIKVVHQKFDLMLADQLSFTQNLQLANMSIYPGLQALPAHQQLPDFVQRFGIDMAKPVYLLSGGQRQILSILMALQKPVSVLLLDEPTAALDDKNSQMVMAFLHHLLQSAGLTILIICHDRELVTTHAQDGYFELSINDQTMLRTLGYVKL
jgi:ABC-type lipoprotein export system ATPase subunit